MYLPGIKELKVEIVQLTQDLIIVKASGSDLEILGTAAILCRLRCWVLPGSS